MISFPLRAMASTISATSSRVASSMTTIVIGSLNRYSATARLQFFGAGSLLGFRGPARMLAAIANANRLATLATGAARVTFISSLMVLTTLAIACGGSSSKEVDCTATAVVDNPAPPSGASVTVTGRLSCADGIPSGTTMEAKWRYASTTETCSAPVTDGSASCSRTIGRPTAGREVPIDITFSISGKEVRTSTAFTPQ